MLRYYKYPLKVWLTTAILGSIGLFLFTYIYDRDMFIGYDLISYFIPITLVMALGAVPYWLCFWYIYSKVVQVVGHRKIILLLTAELVGFIHLTILLAIYPDSLIGDKEVSIILSFIVAIALAVLIYPIQNNELREVTD